MTTELLQKVEERCKLKGVNETLYKDKNREIQRECTERRQQWFDNQCAEVEQLLINNQHLRYEKIK